MKELRVRWSTTFCASADLQHLKVPPCRVASHQSRGHDSRVFKHRCDGGFDYDSFIRSQSLLLISRGWMIHWRGEKTQGFEMVNGTQQWPIEEIYITNCLCTDFRPSACKWFCMQHCVCVYGFMCVKVQVAGLCMLSTGHRQVSLYSSCVLLHRFKFRVLVNKRPNFRGGSSPLPRPLSSTHIDSLVCLPLFLLAWIKQFATVLMRRFQKAKSSRKQLYPVALNGYNRCHSGGIQLERILITGRQQGIWLMIRDALVQTLVSLTETLALNHWLVWNFVQYLEKGPLNGSSFHHVI